MYPQNTSLEELNDLDKHVFQRFASKLTIQPSLSRLSVSFQGNKRRPVYRWYKFKEAFSASLVEHLFYKYGITAGKILDPFAGSGTALFAVLESISFTCKDGQYLRWDYRSGHTHGKKIFNKGEIPEFREAICKKINEILEDVLPVQQTTLFPSEKRQGQIRLYDGSCLQVLPQLPDNTYDGVMTSPPYCNRYDYTRTYALELALLGIDEQGLLRLRQEMLSCTVENRAKDLLSINPRWTTALAAADEQELLQAILKYLEDQKARKALNNNGIPRMVRGYFYEMACVIAECARVLKPNAPLLMVNDNVRYAGASISVDMILSEIAEKLGFQVEDILVLPNSKGNSSQQMGEYGRDPLRKCVYVWRRRVETEHR